MHNGDTCQAGVCAGRIPVICTASDQCHVGGICDTATGVCSNPLKADGSSCSDGNSCTQTDTCQAGVCTGGNPVVCGASDQCHDAGVCNPVTGACSNPAKLDGTSCGDGNACTQTDICLAGVCTPTNPVTCPASDQCHDPGVCDTATGLCSNPPKADDSLCTDGNACTQTDTCQAGVCTGTNTVTCAASDQCHVAGVCDTVAGVCTNPTKADGTACSDGSACTTGDTCQAGACAPGTATTCTAEDQCHVAGVCDTATGICSNPQKADGTSCGDGNPCTQTDACQSGVCTGGNPVLCIASDTCHEPGVCDPGTGGCSDPAKIDGSACANGSVCILNETCSSGTCGGGIALNCNDANVCTADACNPVTGCESQTVNMDTTSFSADRVDGRDLTVLADAWNSCPGEPRYNPAANLDQGTSLMLACVDGADFHLFMTSYGNSCSP